MNIWKMRDWTPMLLQEIFKPFDDDNYLFEIKFDGQRALIFASPSDVKVYNRHHEDITFRYPELQAIKEIVVKNTIFDGEIVAFEDNKPSFSRLQKRAHLNNIKKIAYESYENPIVFMCFDILYMGADLTMMPLTERKEILSQFLDNQVFIKTKYYYKEGKKVFKSIKELGLEGIVAKNISSPYEINTRSQNWLKIKNWREENFFIGGYLESGKAHVVSLFLGKYRASKFIFVGKVSMNQRNSLYDLLKREPLLKKSPFSNPCGECHFIAPKYQCRVAFMEWTDDGHVRQPIFKRAIL